MKNFVLRLWGLHLLLFPVALLIFFSPLIGLHLSNRYEVYLLKQEGDQIREKIEAYRKANGKWPVSLEAGGISNQGKHYFYYRTDEDSGYILRSSIGLGEAVTYSSKTGQWEQGMDD